MKDLTFNPNTIKRISIITGHYGSGKTNVAVNMAIKIRNEFKDKNVTIVDLDIVNPYFRTADFTKTLNDNNIRVISPIYANTNVDAPILPPEINAIFDDKNAYVIVDVGGDDAGAIALGRYSKKILVEDYDMYYVINQCRYQTRNVQSTVELLTEIESSAKVTATKVINNTNLGVDTTLETVLSSFEFADEICGKLELPLAFCTINDQIDIKKNCLERIKMYVKPFYQ